MSSTSDKHQNEGNADHMKKILQVTCLENEIKSSADDLDTASSSWQSNSYLLMLKI